MRETSAERKLFLDQHLAEEAVLLPRGKCQPRDADGDCANEVGEGFGHIVGGKLCCCSQLRKDFLNKFVVPVPFARLKHVNIRRADPEN